MFESISKALSQHSCKGAPSAGRGVALSGNGNTVAIGAPYNDDNGLNSGHVRVFEWSGGSWSQLGSDIDGEAANDLSGTSVSLDSDGDRVAIGARNNDGGGNYLENDPSRRVYMS